MEVLFALFITFLVIFFCVSYGMYLCWRYLNRSCVARVLKLSLSEYIRLRKVNPSKWAWEKEHYSEDLKRITYTESVQYSRYSCLEERKTRIVLSYPGYLIANLMRRAEHFGKVKEAERDCKREFLEDIQKDVNQLIRKAEQEIDEARNITETIGRRM